MTGEGKQGREEQKFFPIITRQNKFDELLVVCQELYSKRLEPGLLENHEKPRFVGV